MPASDISTFDYQERAVAFIDVLGFADLVLESDKGKKARDKARNKVSKLVSADKFLIQFVRKFLTFAETAFFSDSFVLSMQSPESRLFNLVRETGYLCRYLLLQGFLCRGAITTGSLYHQGQFVAGPALVKAYQLEQSVAVYPRIILDNASIKIWRHNFRLIKGQGPANPQHEALVKRDRDGQHFLDIFHDRWPDFLQQTDFVPSKDVVPMDPAEFLEQAAKQIKAGLAKTRKKPRVRSKYEWLATEHDEHAATLGMRRCLISSGAPPA